MDKKRLLSLKFFITGICAGIPGALFLFFVLTFSQILPFLWLGFIPYALMFALFISIFRSLRLGLTEDEFRQDIMKILIKIQEEKRAKRGPRVFYYLDANLIQTLHSQITHGIKPKEIEETDRDEHKRGLGSSIPGVISGEITTSGSTEKKKKFEVNWDVDVMFNVVENYLELEQLVTFNLERSVTSIPIEITENMFFDWLNQDGSLNKQDIPNFVKKRMAQERLNEIQKTKGFVSISGTFTIGSMKRKQRVLTMKHTVSEILKQDIIVDIYVSEENLTPAGEKVLKTGETIPLTVFGKITRWKGNINILEINPIVFY